MATLKNLMTEIRESFASDKGRWLKILLPVAAVVMVLNGLLAWHFLSGRKTETPPPAPAAIVEPVAVMEAASKAAEFCRTAVEAAGQAERAAKAAQAAKSADAAAAQKAAAEAEEAARRAGQAADQAAAVVALLPRTPPDGAPGPSVEKTRVSARAAAEAGDQAVASAARARAAAGPAPAQPVAPVTEPSPPATTFFGVPSTAGGTPGPAAPAPAPATPGTPPATGATTPVQLRLAPRPDLTKDKYDLKRAEGIRNGATIGFAVGGADTIVSPPADIGPRTVTFAQEAESIVLSGTLPNGTAVPLATCSLVAGANPRVLQCTLAEGAEQQFKDASAWLVIEVMDPAARAIYQCMIARPPVAGHTFRLGLDLTTPARIQELASPPGSFRHPWPDALRLADGPNVLDLTNAPSRPWRIDLTWPTTLGDKRGPPVRLILLFKPGADGLVEVTAQCDTLTAMKTAAMAGARRIRDLTETQATLADKVASLTDDLKSADAMIRTGAGAATLPGTTGARNEMRGRIAKRNQDCETRIRGIETTLYNAYSLAPATENRLQSERASLSRELTRNQNLLEALNAADARDQLKKNLDAAQRKLNDVQQDLTDAPKPTRDLAAALDAAFKEHGTLRILDPWDVPVAVLTIAYEPCKPDELLEALAPRPR